MSSAYTPHTSRRFASLAPTVFAVTLAACADTQSGPTGPNDTAPVAAVAAATGTSLAAQLAADALTRLLPALEKDAAAPLGNALRDLDARLADPAATLAAQDRSLRVAENVLAQFTDPTRADAADLDAVRLAVAEIGTLLRQ